MADILFYNGAIYTMNPAQPRAEAILVSGERIVYAGGLSEAENYITDDTKRFDLGGKMLLPGFVDAHCHPSLCAFFSSGILLDVQMNQEEIITAVSDYIDSHPEQDAYFGIGYPEWIYDEKDPRKETLDQICNEKPILILGSGGHEGWCNSMTFEKAGITKETVDPVPGFQYFERDAGGELTGHLVELGPQEMIFSSVKFFDREKIEKNYLETFADYSRMGVTMLADCGAFDYMEEVSIPFFEEYFKRDDCKQRISGCAFTGSKDKLETTFDKLKERNKKYNSDLYKVDTYKLILDGTIESRSASMIEPYNEDGSLVKPLLEGEELASLFIRAAASGFDIHCHGIGDRAIHEVLMAAKAVREEGYQDTRITNAHTEHIAQEDRPLFGKYHVIANTTGVWHYGNPDMFRIVGDRAREQFVLRPVLEYGGRLSLGSDRPVDEYGSEPLKNIQVAMNRQLYGDRDGFILEPADGGLSLQQCLEGYTINGADQLHMEKKTGSLEPGKYADLVILGQDLYETDPYEIYKVPVIMTMMNGRITHNEENNIYECE